MPQTITVPIDALQAGTPDRPITLDVGAPPPEGPQQPAGEGNLRVPLDTLEKVAAVEHPPAEDEGILGFARHFGQQINPIPLGQLLPFPKALGGAGLDAPLEAAKNILAAQGHVGQKMVDAFHKGEYVQAAEHALAWLTPILGPVLDKAGEEMKAGKFAAGTGDALGLGTALFAPTALARVKAGVGMGAPTPPAAPTLTPAELASNAFARTHDIPLDAATETGSRFVRGVQKIAGESMLGEAPAVRLRTAQQQALTRVGGELGDEVRPAGPRSPEQAGAGATGALEGLVQQLKGQANQAYGRLRELEGQAAPEQVPDQRVAEADKGRASLQQTTLGYQPQPDVLRELRRIRAEMDAYPYEGATWTDLSDETGLHGNAAGGHAQRTAGHAGAPVYDDILAMQPGSSQPTRAEVLASIDRALETGRYDNAAKGALNVADLRLRGGNAPVGRISKPMLPPDAGDVGPGRTVGMRFAVDMRDAKAAIRPIYERLQREGQLAPLMGDKAEALRAMDRLVNGPDYAPLSEADAAAGHLKTIARSDDPLFRSAGQGAVSKAAQALDEAIQLRAAGAGDEVYDALKAGRAATRAKYEVGGILDELRDEPVATFRKLTANLDQNIALLRRVQEAAPGSMADLGRAKLEEWLDLATERNRFDHVDRIYAEWQKLGPQTKRLLFGDARTIEQLDQFFLLAKRIAENPNPSGTAGTAIKTTEIMAPITALTTLHPLAALSSITASIGMGAVARLLYSPGSLQALTDVLRASARRTGRAAASSADLTAALSRLATAAKAEGVDLPLAADRRSRDSNSRR